jgi:hypothetical protein
MGNTSLEPHLGQIVVVVSMLASNVEGRGSPQG